MTEIDKNQDDMEAFYRFLDEVQIQFPDPTDFALSPTHTDAESSSDDGNEKRPRTQLDVLGENQRHGRRVDELNYLEKRVQELQLELEQLQISQANDHRIAVQMTDSVLSRTPQTVQGLRTFEGTMQMTLYELWRGAAHQERKNVQRALMDNIYLRRQLGHMVGSAKGMVDEVNRRKLVLARRSTTQTNKGTKKVAGIASAPRRRRARDNIMDMRNLVHDLQTQVQQLREQRAFGTETDLGITANNELSFPSQKHPLMTTRGVRTLTQVYQDKLKELWKDAAAREKVRRNNAVFENFALHEMISNQLAIAKRLEALLLEQCAQNPSVSLLSNGNEIASDDLIFDRDPGFDFEIFEMISVHFVRQYAEIDLVLQTANLAEKYGVGVGVDQDGVYLQSSLLLKLPLTWPDLGDAYWNLLLLASRPMQSGTYNGHGAAQDIMWAKMSNMVWLALNMAPTTLNEFTAIKRIVEPQREVLLGGTRTKLTGAVNLSVRTMTYGIFEASPMGETNWTSQARFVMRAYPQMGRNGWDGRIGLIILRDFMIDLTRRIEGAITYSVLLESKQRLEQAP